MLWKRGPVAKNFTYNASRHICLLKGLEMIFTSISEQ